MVSTDHSSAKDDMQFDLNLVPFIDMLSTCICFLLMTAIWIHVGVFNVSQAIGDEPPAGGKNPPSVIVDIRDGGDVQFSLKDVERSGKPQARHMPATRRGIDWNGVEGYVAALEKRFPELKTVLVMPSARTQYDDVIRLMDTFKKHQINQIGIAPLVANR